VVDARTKARAAAISPLARAADLHVHTTHSDGACTPGDVVRSAASVGLGGLAITDHDTLSAIAVARPEADRLGVELIAGVELTAEREGREIHILGHFVRDDDPALLAAVADLRTRRAARIEAMAGRLTALGLSVDLVAIRNTFPRATIGRKHLADWLAWTGQVAGPREAFSRYLGDGGVAQVPKPRLDWREAISLIRAAGGVAGLAHPPFNLRQCTLAELAEGGLGAIEVAGPAVDRRCGLRWRGWADALGLAPIAGTDFHAPDRPGRWVGAITTPVEDLETLRSHRNQASSSSSVQAVESQERNARSCSGLS
jgi:3',5'-nucleoside bisphosphate phosphatase